MNLRPSGYEPAGDGRTPLLRTGSVFAHPCWARSLRPSRHRQVSRVLREDRCPPWPRTRTLPINSRARCLLALADKAPVLPQSAPRARVRQVRGASRLPHQVGSAPPRAKPSWPTPSPRATGCRSDLRRHNNPGLPSKRPYARGCRCPFPLLCSPTPRGRHVPAEAAPRLADLRRGSGLGHRYERREVGGH